MSILVEEVKKAVSKSAVTGSIVTKYYYSRAPQTTSYPYCVFYILLDTYSGNDTGTKYSNVVLQFNTFDNKNDYGKRCNDTLEQIMTYYDLAKDTLTVSGYTIINAYRDFIIPPREVETVWQGTVQYTLHIKN